jgi:serine/threonine-protein kinase
MSEKSSKKPDVQQPAPLVPPVGVKNANRAAASRLATPVGNDDTVAVRLQDVPPADAPVANDNGHNGAKAAKNAKVREDPEDADALPQIPLLAEGETIGPYEVRGHVGDGGMASVYRVWHTGLHRYEALKVPRQQGRYGPEAAFLRRLLAEARTAAQLHHPNIAAIHTISDAASPLQYFSMEFISGGDLASLLEKRGRLASREALSILSQIASALDYAHSQSVIHRDIKPANVLLQKLPSQSEGIEDDGADTAWEAKVVDFGISRAGEDTGGTRLTRSGMIVGTPEYMSPEQAGSGEPVTHRTDIYSLGCVAYEMLCGTPPFTVGDGVSRLSLLNKHVGDNPTPPTKYLPGLPPAANAVLLQVLSKKPEDRFATCTEFVDKLAETLENAAHLAISRRRTMFAAAASSSAARTTHRAVSDADGTSLFEPVEFDEDVPEAANRRPRNSTLMAALGGLLVGAAMVFGWSGFGTQPIYTAPTTAVAAMHEESLPVASEKPENSGSGQQDPALRKTALVPSGTSKTAPVVNATRATPKPTVALPTASPVAALIVKRVKKLSTVPFARQTRPNASLLRGQKKVIQQGRNGQREVQFDITYRGSKELARKVVGSRVITPSVPQVVISGTRAPAPIKVADKATPNRATRRAKSAAPIRTTTRRSAVRSMPVRRPAIRRATPSRKRPVKRSAGRSSRIPRSGEAPLPP